LNQTAKPKAPQETSKGVELFEKANAEYDAGRFSQALELFDMAIATGMESEVIHNNKGTTLDAIGRSHEAIQSYRKAVSINPSYELAWHNLGNCYYVQEMFDEAVRAYGKASRLNAKRKENWSGLSAAYARLGARKKANAAIERLASFSEKDKSVILLQADLFLDAGFPEKALQKCEAYIEEKPEDVQGYVRLGNVAHEMGEYNKAIFAYGRALKITPEDKEIWNNLGYTCFSRGYLERAHECFDKAISIDPKYKHAWYNKGYAYHGADMLEEAVKCYEKAIELDSWDKVLWNNLGNALYNLGRFVDSIPKFVEAIRVDPDYEIAWNNIGNALEKVWAFKEAIPFHDRSLEISPEFDYALYAKGVCEANIGSLEHGYDLILESLDLNPSYDEAWKARSTVESQMGRRDEALLSIEQSLLINPEFDQGWVERGEILLATDDREGAQACFEMALKCLERVNPQLPSGLSAVLRRGDVLARLGRFEEALTNYETVALTGKMDFASIPKALRIRTILGRMQIPEALKAVAELSKDVKVKAEFADFLLDAGEIDAADQLITEIRSALGGPEELLVHARSRALKADSEGAIGLLSSNRSEGSNGGFDLLEGELRESKGDLFGAARVYKKRLETNPGNQSAAVALARTQLKLKEFRGAIRTADIAIGIDSKDWEPHKIKADAYSCLGEKERARAEVAQVTSLLETVGLKPEDVGFKVVS
jgi:tetratricopeptide (TPR) repeat protein